MSYNIIEACIGSSVWGRLTAPQHAGMDLDALQSVAGDSELPSDLQRRNIPHDHTAIFTARVRHRLTAPDSRKKNSINIHV